MEAPLTCVSTGIRVGGASGGGCGRRRRREVEVLAGDQDHPVRSIPADLRRAFVSL